MIFLRCAYDFGCVLSRDKCKHFKLGLGACLNNILAQTDGYYQSKQENAATYTTKIYFFKYKKYITGWRILRRRLMGIL